MKNRGEGKKTETTASETNLKNSPLLDNLALRGSGENISSGRFQRTTGL
jgi:hypothetical protein